MARYEFSDRFRELKATGQLPSPRGVALSIVRLLESDRAGIPELSKIVQGDPAFVGRLIKAANSIVPVSRRPVVSVNDALLVLGMPAVRNLALGFSLLNEHASGSCAAFDYDHYWTGSLAIALCLQAIARPVRLGAPDELFSFGLLSRVGELGLATAFPSEYAVLLDAVRDMPSESLSALEQQAFAVDHHELTAAMIDDWGLPALMVDSVLNLASDVAAADRTGRLIRSLRLARSVASMIVSERCDHAILAQRLRSVADSIGLGEEDLMAAVTSVSEHWTSWCDQFRLPDQEIPDLAGILAPAEMAQGVSSEEDVVVEGPEALVVLIAEPDPTEAARLVALVSGTGMSTVVSADGASTLEQVFALKPDILICSADLPENGGFPVVQALRRTRLGREIYCLMLTHVADEAEVVRTLDAGCDDFISRPFMPRLFSARLAAARRSVLIHRELLREREEIRRYAAKMAVSHRRLQEVAVTDTLTGFRNRRYAMERLGHEWLESMRTGRSLACMMIDADGFKQVNDRFGHAAGDEALSALALALRGALRSQDIVCRMGGDEFLVICPETALRAALTCAERLRKAVLARGIDASGRMPPLTVSVGVAERDASMAEVSGLVEMADRAAYRAKRDGRNRVVCLQRVRIEDEHDPRRHRDNIRNA